MRKKVQMNWQFLKNHSLKVPLNQGNTIRANFCPIKIYQILLHRLKIPNFEINESRRPGSRQETDVTKKLGAVSKNPLLKSKSESRYWDHLFSFSREIKKFFFFCFRLKIAKYEKTAKQARQEKTQQVTITRKNSSSNSDPESRYLIFLYTNLSNIQRY